MTAILWETGVYVKQWLHAGVWFCSFYLFLCSWEHAHTKIGTLMASGSIGFTTAKQLISHHSFVFICFYIAEPTINRFDGAGCLVDDGRAILRRQCLVAVLRRQSWYFLLFCLLRAGSGGKYFFFCRSGPFTQQHTNDSYLIWFLWLVCADYKFFLPGCNSRRLFFGRILESLWSCVDHYDIMHEGKW